MKKSSFLITLTSFSRINVRMKCSLFKVIKIDRKLKILNTLIAVDPKFFAPILNVTVPVSRDAILTCKVNDLYQYKVSLYEFQFKSFSTSSFFLHNYCWVIKNVRVRISTKIVAQNQEKEINKKFRWIIVEKKRKFKQF